LRRFGLSKLAALEPKPPVVRYQPEQPGELIHIDVKKLGRIEAVRRAQGGRGDISRPCASLGLPATALPSNGK